ncbi:unnamed protein product [Clavelina lepadiformis]|uniref:Secreted protein n=1 Tax=Clavelina lepadiformis TaxID=159417 RepID=A0ABP0FLB4_CLALP
MSCACTFLPFSLVAAFNFVTVLLRCMLSSLFLCLYRFQWSSLLACSLFPRMSLAVSTHLIRRFSLPKPPSTPPVSSQTLPLLPKQLRNVYGSCKSLPSVRVHSFVYNFILLFVLARHCHLQYVTFYLLSFSFRSGGGMWRPGWLL